MTILDKRVLEYLKKQYEKGHDLSTVEDVLVRSGYSRDQIEHAIEEIKAHNDDSSNKSSKKKSTSKKVDSKKEAKKTEEKKEKKVETHSKKEDHKADPIKKAVEEEAKPKKKKTHSKHVQKVRDKLEKHGGYFHKLFLVMFDLDAFFDEVGEGEGLGTSFLFHFGTFFLILPIIMAGALFYYGTFAGAAGGNVVTSLITFFVGSVALFACFTVMKLIGLIPIHFMVKVMGSERTISKTWQAYFYGMTPAVLFLWIMPIFPVFLVFSMYGFFTFYEGLRKFHNFDRRQTVMSIVLGMLLWMIILILVVLSIDPLLLAISRELSYANIFFA